jgi:hypothetical protein
VTLTRAEANAVAFRVVRSILDAADTLHTFELVVEDRPIQVELSRGSASALPAGGLLGIDPDRDGVVPRPVRASATWLGGSVTLDVRLDWWRGGSYKSLVGSGVYVADSRQNVLWNTLAITLEGSGDGSAVVSASVAPEPACPSRPSGASSGFASALPTGRLNQRLRRHCGARCTSRS